MPAPLLEIKNVSKSFPGVRALDGVSLRVDYGSVHALMGENGAGKSTLMKCLFGVYKPDSGEIFLEGEEITPGSPKAALISGVAMVHQELNVAEKLSLAENMWLGRFPLYSPFLPFINKRKMREDTKEVYAELGLSCSPDRKMEEMSVSERQMAEIAKAVSYDAKIIVFDEPTSSLTEEEAERLFKIIDKLKNEGLGIVYISHKMNEILRISDTVSVMRDGKMITTEKSENMTTEKIIRLMVGRELASSFPKREGKRGEVLFTAEELVGEYTKPRGVSISLRRGEILGIAGLDGSGRTELLLSIFGLLRLRSGTLTLNGKKIRNRSPREAISNGFALITEERRRNGIFGILDINKNTVISSLRRYSRLGFVNEKRTSEATRGGIKRLRVKTHSEREKIKNLSGGNQQKVILARWLLTEPTVLMLDEPTRGIDVGAKYEIYSILSSLASEGRGIIVVSSEMPELLGICDRIAVMSGGRIAGELNAAVATQEEIMTLATKYAE